MDYSIKTNEMKTYAHHDHEGNIKSLIVVDAPNHIGLMLTAQPGVFVTEMEGIKFKSKSPSIEELQAVMRDYKVSPSKSKGKAERKNH